jgi:hypothetical protein
MDRRHPWLRVVFVLLLVVGAGKALRDLSVEASKADDAGRPPASGALFDYRDTAFNPSRDLLGGHNPYDHVEFMARHPGTQEFDFYPPSWFVIAVPASLPPYHVGQTIWWCTLVAGIAALALLSLRAARVDVDAWRVAGLTGALLLSLPGSQVMRSGQQSFLFACCLLVVVLWPDRWRWVGAAGILVLASKPQFIGPVVILLAMRREAWAALTRGVVLVVAASILPVALMTVAAGGVGDLVTSVRDNLDYSSQTQNDLSVASDNIRLDVLNTFGKFDIARPTTGLQLIMAVVVLAVAAVAVRRARAGSALLFTVIATATLVSLPHYRYDLAIAVPAIVMLVAGARGAASLAPAWRWGLTVLLTVPMLEVYQADKALDEIGLPLEWRQSVGSLSTGAAFAVACAAVFMTTRALTDQTTSAFDSEGAGPARRS